MTSTKKTKKIKEIEIREIGLLVLSKTYAPGYNNIVASLNCERCSLGLINDVILFFDCIDWFVVPNYPNQDWSLITDRFYKRYLRLEELEPARKLMDKIRKIFSTVSSSEVDWTKILQGDPNKTWLDSSLPTLDLIFLKFFEEFNNAVDELMYNYDTYGRYTPIRLTMMGDVFYRVSEQFRPLKQYDSLGDTDKPFWMLPENEIRK